MRSPALALLIGLGLVAETALVLGVPVTGMVDGGLHLHGAVTLRDALTGLEPPASDYLEWFPFPVPNLLPEVGLAGLTTVMAPDWADRFLIIGYVVSFPLAMLYAVRGVRAGAGWLALMAFPLTFNFLLHYGFYNFVFSLVLFLVTAGYVIRHASALNRRTSLVIGGLLVVTFLTHAVGFVESLLFVAVFVATVPGRVNSRESHAPVLLAVIVAVGLGAILVFLTGTGSLRPSAYGSKPREIAETLALTWELWSFVRLEVLLILILPLTLGFLLVVALRHSRHPTLARRPPSPLLIFVVASFLVVVLAPPGIESGGSFLTQRLALFPVFGLILWLAAQPLPPATMRLAGTAFMIVALSLALARLSTYQQLSRAVEDFMTAAPCVAQRSTMLQASLHLPGLDEPWRLDPLSAEASRLAAETHGLDLGNAEWEVPYYLLRFRAARDPFEMLPTPPGAAGLEAIPPMLDIRGYERSTGGGVDYVLVVGRATASPEVLASTAWTSLRRQLGSMYIQVFSSPAGWVEVWERRVPEVRAAGDARRRSTHCSQGDT